MPAAGVIIERWGISDPVDPAKSFDPSGSGSEGRPSFSKKRFDLAEEDKNNPELKRAKELRVIQVQIDIAQTLEEIFEDLESRIEMARTRYRAEIGRLPDFRNRSRVRLDQYDNCLKVWDLRKQDLTFEQIARTLFPLETRTLAFRGTVTKRVRSQFQRAKELIEGGYKQIEG